MSRILVTGAGGFIGHHLVKFLRARGHWVRGVDIKLPRFEDTQADDFLLIDLRYRGSAETALDGVDEVYHLAANMGGMGHLTREDHRIMYDNSLINTYMIEAAARASVERFVFTSSACVYPESRQLVTDVAGLAERDAYPAEPDTGYGWEKLYAERMCLAYAKAYGLPCRIARLHNVYGPLGSWNDGREKAPAALCRKVAEAKLTGKPRVEIWGDGEQTRSFLYITDCLEGLRALAGTDTHVLVNIGSERLISINDLVDMIAEIAGVAIEKVHVSGPQGVRGRCSDNTRCRAALNWEPSVSLEEGIAETYHWIEGQMAVLLNPPPPRPILEA